MSLVKEGKSFLPSFKTSPAIVVALLLIFSNCCFNPSTSSPDITMSKLSLTFHAINCNSLNSSLASKKNQMLKVHGITSLKSDIIFLSDIRLSNRNLISCADDISKTFRTNLNSGYEFFHNSTRNKRGVGILVKHDIDFAVLDRWDEPGENALLLKLSIGGETLIIGSIYGPNETCTDFFDNVFNKLSSWGNYNCILAGDWNCVYSTDNTPYNIDCLNMANLPNPRNTSKLVEICENLNLVDPFRHLYPDKLDYSYVPRDPRKTNRSRLDFFIVNSALLSNISECKIEHGLQNSLFDHKSIFLKLGRATNIGVKKCTIRNSILDIDTVKLIVDTTVAETYLLHLNEGAMPAEAVQEQLTEIGLIKYESKAIAVPYRYWPDGAYSDGDVLRRTLLLENLTNRASELNIRTLEQLDLNCDRMTFMEVLLNNIRNEVVSFQSFFFKWTKKVKAMLKKDLEILKTNYTENSEQIFHKESTLNKLLDEEARRELEHFSMFEILNMEKMTPAFLNIAKQTKSSAKLADICNDAGEKFDSDTELKNYIRKYYAEIYKVKPDTERNVIGCIEKFLGPEILANPNVRNRKLTEEQRESLERDLSVDELDRAIEKMNPRTAGGPDGIGTAVLKKFWGVLRVPLCRYGTEMMSQERMSPSFLVSSIKLIPKKGDVTKIKNWRPISLLNCVYKVVSKAINNRLKSISDSILSRAQKGFANNRYIQECLININETIAYCNKNKVPGMLVAIDQAKAFDTVNQEFVKEVYKFFGLGPRFMKMLEITTTGRSATILFDDGTSSEPVKLGTGFTQGNGPSPLQFNFCQEVLIIKFEFDGRIKSIEWHIPNSANMNTQGLDQQQVPELAVMGPPDPDLPDADEPRTEDGAITDATSSEDDLSDPDPGSGGKVEGFADDTSVLSLAEKVALDAIKENLLNFEKFSGLRVNFDKCVILVMGCDNVIPEFITSSGFNVSAKVTILGMEIFADTSLLTKNFDKVLTQLINIRNFWTRFNLSLPGRICVAKTLMLSRLGYLGCILDPDQEQLDEIEKLIYSFVKGRLAVAGKKITADPALGGLGMINIKNYLIALKCSWVVRARKSVSDHWSKMLHRTGITDPDSFRLFNCSLEHNPMLNIIKTCMQVTIGEHLKINNNLLASSLLDNPVFVYPTGTVRAGGGAGAGAGAGGGAGTGTGTAIFNLASFTGCNIQDNILRDIKLNDIVNYTGTRLKEIEVLNIELRATLTIELYTKLEHALRNAVKKSYLTNNDTVKPQCVNPICDKIKKGSKIFRKILENSQSDEKKILNQNSFRKFCELIGIRLVSKITIKNSNVIWQQWGVANKVKEFSYKFFNNLLGIKSRIGHFVARVDEGCTFCTLRSMIPTPRETFFHLFFECPETDRTLKGFEDRYLSSLNLDNVSARTLFWFFGTIPDNLESRDSIFFRLTMIIVQYYVWDCKLQKRNQSLSSCLDFYFFHMEIVRKVNKKVSKTMSKVNLDLCRYWQTERGRGW
jgi:exonuclease III